MRIILFYLRHFEYISALLINIHKKTKDTPIWFLRLFFSSSLIYFEQNWNLNFTDNQTLIPIILLRSLIYTKITDKIRLYSCWTVREHASFARLLSSFFIWMTDISWRHYLTQIIGEEGENLQTNGFIQA